MMRSGASAVVGGWMKRAAVGVAVVVGWMGAAAAQPTAQPADAPKVERSEVEGGNIVIKAETVYTMAGAVLKPGVVVITGGKIAAVGGAEVEAPAGYAVMEAKVATPGLVDAHGAVGLTGIYNTPHDSDQIERSAPIQPELRALDAYNPQEPLVAWVRSFGVTTVHTGHAPGELISGQTIIVKLKGNTVEEALVRSPAMVAATLGPGSQKGGDQAPGTRGKQVALLREQLIRAREYAEKRGRREHGGNEAGVRGTGANGAETKTAEKADDTREDDQDGTREGGRDLRLEMLADVLAGKTPLLVTANRAQDLRTALRLAEEFKFRVVLDMAAEAYVLAEEIKRAGVPVILHPQMYRAVGETENQSFTTAAVLKRAGVPVAIQSGYEGYVPKVRVVLFEAAQAAANGLSFEEALGTVTIESARILGIEERVGSLAVGKDGDVACYDGDPFEYTTHCTGVVIDGVVVSREVR